MSVTEHLKRLLLKGVCLDFYDQLPEELIFRMCHLEKQNKELPFAASNSNNSVSYYPVLDKEPGSMDHKLLHKENCSEAISRALFSS